MLYTVVDVIDHSIMKESVLDLIDNMPHKDVGEYTVNLDDEYTDLNYDYTSHIEESGSEHPWHHHADSERKSGEKNTCINLASIYYVELPDESLITILKDPETGKEVIPDVKEGQILTFGADILHKSPRNFSNNRKTVIPFNIMFD